MACSRGGLVKYYEYDEEIYLSIDGSATVYLNASIPALVNLRGMDLDTRPNANLDRAKIRRLFSTEATRVTRVSRWRRFGRQFVQVRMAVDDIGKLGSAAPFSWATYRVERRDDLVVYRQQLGAAAGKAVGDVGWKGNELIAVRVHLPSRIRYHNAGADNLRRGNILVWEQSLAERQSGKPLEIEARIEQTSILYSTLLLFAVSGLLAILVLAVIIWWVVRKGRRAA
jgi:preprotein translocase subunit Sec61beta